MKLFFDTETTGFKDPRLVQLAAILTDDEGLEQGRLNYIIKPVNFEIPAEASKIHGITTAQALEVGIEVAVALTELDTLLKQADELIAHNINFDLGVLKNEVSKQLEFAHFFQPLPRLFCTMSCATNVCRIAGRYAGKYKWPTLQEAYTFAFKEQFGNAHNALADVEACSKLYFWLKKN